MSLKMRPLYLVLLAVVVVALVFLVVWNPLRASPGLQGGVDLQRYAELKTRVEELRQAGRDVAYLDTIVADVDYWIANDKVAEANLRITDLEGALNDFQTMVQPTVVPEAPLPPAPALAPVVNPDGAVLLEEDFSGQGVLSGWESRIFSDVPGTMATWEVRQQALYLNEGAGSPEIVGMVELAASSWSDYVYSVDILPQGNVQVGVVFRYSDGSFYRFRFLSEEYQGVGTWVLERVVGDETVVLDIQDGPGYVSGQWYNVQILADGAQLEVYLNGERVLQAADEQLSQGKIGVYALCVGHVYFDNIRVTAVR